MFKQGIYTAACYLAFSERGNQIAKQGFKVATRLGNVAVRSMPKGVGDVFRNVESGTANLFKEEEKDAHVRTSESNLQSD